MKIAANKSSGFTLVEVLIAVVILSIGLLGLAGLQTLALRQNTSSQARSNAVELINDLADRMRANTTAENIDPNPYLLAAVADPGWNCMTTFNAAGSCSAADMAALDLFAWQTAVTQIMPAGVGLVVCIDSVPADAIPCTAGSAYTISVTWTDGALAGGIPAPTTFAVTFQL